MKIKTITCHDVYNYGASLQAYALSTYLKSIGHDVEIIDYMPEYQSGRYDFWNIPKTSRLYKYARMNRLFYFICCLYQINWKYSTYARKKPFDKFKLSNLLCTRKYNTYEELKNDPPKSDIYIVGSDQVWSCTSPLGTDPAYYLDFGSTNIKRYSYAASFGQSSVKEENVPFVVRQLSKFEKISVREKTALQILESLGYKGIHVVDPVLLLNQQDWEKLIVSDRMVKSDYILVYDMYHSDNEIKKAVISIAKEKNLKIVSVNSRGRLSYANKNISNAGPIEFLNLVKYCTFCVSSSFHATAFSVIFQKPFFVFNKHDNVSRIKDFLEMIGMPQCLNPMEYKVAFDYGQIGKRLQPMITLSKQYLSEF